MGIAIPNFGNPGYIYNEDFYSTGEMAIVKGASNAINFDNKNMAPQEVVISCEHKHGRVSGLLNGGLKLNGHAEWTEMMGGGIMSLGGSMIETGNNLLQFTSGSSIQQPWMNRKMWKTTKPFSFDIPMSFVATTDPLNDVVRPCMALMSFIFPRELETKDGEQSNAYTKLNSMSGGKLGKVIGNSSLVGTALESIAFYNIPGPALRYGTKNAKGTDNEGDPVKIVIGKLFAFGACYLEDVSVEWSQSSDFEGYPIAANVNVKATVMDAACCQTDGNFLIQEFYGSSENVGNFLDKFGDTITQAATDFANIVEKGIGFYKTPLGIFNGFNIINS